MDSEADSNKPRSTFGLPRWMVGNISERLNTATDFEQYASSPPQTESFLAEYPDNRESWSSSESPKVDTIDKPERSLPTRPLKPSCDFKPYRPLLSHEDPHHLVSSPDSTPCVTPEPSPVVRRKISIPSPGDTVQTNPGGWFYMGKFRKGKENCSEEKREERKPYKMVITLSEMNAYSPTSW